jgi:hypothetical protein
MLHETLLLRLGLIFQVLSEFICYLPSVHDQERH